MLSHFSSRPARPPSRSLFTAVLLLMTTLLTLAACGASGVGSTAGQSSATATSPSAASTTTAPAVRYVALGASDAVGVGATDPNRTAYVPIIISRLPKGSAALNLGISGETLHQALDDEVTQAVAANPTLITVWLVGNDFKNCVPLAQYGADLNTLLTKLQQQTHAKIFVANAPDFSALPAVQAQAASGSFCGAAGSLASVRALAQQWNQVINASVAAHHDTLVDLFNTDLASHPGYVSNDGFHPSDQGYLALANLFWSAITAQGAAQAA
ncbi:MAG TPA: SGNH/GDSL hydrolase family protein [Ktedonobacterales bacterium]|jgi:lysophospholipase L1-like esterase|nr:SGNH/GDSL hydrolase family protein [Ktedonobacterales bacterium]